MKNNPAPLRSYGDPCGIARALDVVGERWALLIVRELAFGPKRFTDLRAGLHGASPNVLSQRLRELESAAVVRRTSEGAASYELTERGQELHPILKLLGAWGARNTPRPGGDLSIDALLVALETTFVEKHARDLHARYELRLGEQRFSIDVGGGSFDIARGSPARADAIILTNATTLRACAFGDLAVNDAIAAGALDLRGDRKLARAFFRLFSRPKPTTTGS